MPWEKTFDENKAIYQAMLLFWEKGYSDTSMADLLKATGLTKGSFYNAFGSKYDLYLKTLIKYDLENRRKRLEKFKELDSPIQSIKAFIRSIIQEAANDCHKKGCFLANTSLDLNSETDEVKSIIVDGLGDTENFFKEMIEKAQNSGDVPADLNPAKTAKALMGTVVSISVLGRGVFDQDGLETLAEQGLKLLT